MINISDHSFYSIGGDPISEDQPCGNNIRYEPEFEQLEAELAKQESLNAETVDWVVVGDLSSQIIQKSSKDLLVGSYLCYALLVKEGYTGLATGLNILNDMVTHHWDGLFPPIKRMRARQTALTWLAEKAGLYVSDNAPDSSDSVALLEAVDKIKLLDNALLVNMGDQAPVLADLARPLKNYRQSAKAGLAKAEQALAKGEETVQQASAEAAVETGDSVVPAQAAGKAAATAKTKPVTANTGTIESDADCKKILRQVQTTMRDIAAFQIAQKLSDPRSYRQIRVAAWMVIEDAPPANKGVTQINPPTPERLKFFDTLLEKDDHTALIPELEKTLARSAFWLDGHFLLVKSLRAMGTEYDAAVQAVIRELRNFLDRLPAVTELSFSDEAPFASDQTRMWLDAEVLGREAKVGTLPGSEGNIGEAWDAALSAAKQLAASGDTGEALNLMNKGLGDSKQLRDQVYWRYSLAALLLQTGDAEAAAAILEQVSQQAREMKLAEWEPRFMAKTYSLLFKSYQKQQKTNKGDKSLGAKAEQAFEQLCWFDPVTALSVKGG